MPNFENDTIIRRVKETARLMLLLPKADPSQGNDSKERALKLKDALMGCLAAGQINEGENLLFQTIGEDPSPFLLEAALDFYADLARFREIQLERMGFSEDEVLESLEELKRIYRLDIYDI